MKIVNAKQKPQLYFGLHMAEGAAEYREQGKQMYRVFVGEDTIKNMDPSFQGCPVYVHHKDDVDLDKLQEEADGYVVRSFYNPTDGKHWAEFMIVSDRGHEAIRNGWKLSNAYFIKDARAGGTWHGIDYSKEVTRGEYEHLAIVRNPRYAESVIMTPEQFKLYNNEKELELKRLANSQTDKGEEGMLNLFSKKKVENSADLEATMVSLPKCKKEMTIAQVCNAYDELAMENKSPYMCNGEERVKVGEEEMSVNELVAKHLEMVAKDPKAENMTDEEKKAALLKKENEEKEKVEKEKADSDKKANDLKIANEKKATEDAEKKANLEKIQNAEKLAREQKNAPVISLGEDKVARGKAKYGSN